MSSFVNERYLDIELILNEESGLKVPNSSIIEKEFYLINENFVIFDAVNNIYYVILSGYDDTGQPITIRKEISVYSHDEEAHVYYVDETFLTAGDTLHMENSQQVFAIKDKGTLTGVYNINKGYADFKEITILAQNDEYAIVKPNSTYGLRVYDYIALRADTVSDDQFINE